MGDGPNSEIDTSAKSSSRLTRGFWSFLREKLNTRSNKPPQASQNTESWMEFVGSTKEASLQLKLNRVLGERQITPPDFESQGASGFFSTNERLNPELFQRIREYTRRPNGYIIGVGSAVF